MSKNALMHSFLRLPPNLINPMCNTPYCTPRKTMEWQESTFTTQTLNPVSPEQEKQWIEEWVSHLVLRELSPAVARQQGPVPLSIELSSDAIAQIKHLLQEMGQVNG